MHIYADCDKRLGAPKICHVLKRDYGIKISIGRVYRLMKNMQLPKMSTDKPRNTSHIQDIECSNHLKQQFNQNAPNLVWVSDITYLKAGSKWYYLCVILDLFSRKVIAWNVSPKSNAELVISTFRKAYLQRNCPAGLMFHSDRGTQYTASSFRQLLDSLDVVQSFSKKGYPFDNAVCECFFKYLKKEATNRRKYSSMEHLKLHLFEYIDGYYNSKRPHGSLGYLTPNKKENIYFNQIHQKNFPFSCPLS